MNADQPLTLADTVELLAGNGFVLRRIAPADSPRVAELTNNSGLNIAVRQGDELRPSGPVPPPGTVRRSNHLDDGAAGRAGLHYRDLLEDRLDGHIIASLISVADGGPVSDYVHHHRIGFQLIHCRSGWVDMVYGEQGPPFRMVAGDSVLQPPGIRHRVLAASEGLEVFEVGSPAEHDTLADPERVLPDEDPASGSVYGAAQRFVWAHAQPFSPLTEGWEIRDTGIGDASAGAGEVVTLRAAASAPTLERTVEAGRVWLGFVDHGSAAIDATDTAAGHLVAVVGPTTVRLDPGPVGVEVIEVDLQLGLEPATV